MKRVQTMNPCSKMNELHAVELLPDELLVQGSAHLYKKAHLHEMWSCLLAHWNNHTGLIFSITGVVIARLWLTRRTV